MANHYGAARSNYFKVKDATAFKKAMDEIPGIGVWERADFADAITRFGVYEDDGDGSGCWPTTLYKEDGEDEEIDLFALVAAHLKEGEVAVFEQSGAEKLRYITGSASAVNAKGEVLSISLGDIYEMAHKAWGITPTTATY